MNEFLKDINFSNFSNVKIDIGLSYNAPHSQLWLENNKDNKLLVLGVEPNPYNINSLISKNNKKQHIDHGDPIQDKYINNQFFIIPVALSNIDTPTNKIFYSMNKDSGTSSLNKPIDSSLGEIKDIVTVPVYSLKHLFDVFPWDKIDKIDYIKIDAQGSDLDILISAGDYLKERVVYITAEAEFYAYENCSHNNVNNIDKYLRSQNFIRIKHPNTIDPTYINTKFINIAKDIFIKQIG